MRLVLTAMLAACGGGSTHEPGPTPLERVREAEAPLVARGERLTDPISSAIEDAIDADVGYPVRVVARIDLGDRMLVLYTMNGLTHWLARHPDRAALTATIDECEAQADDDGGPTCIDRTLRDARRPELLAEYLASCLARNDGLDNAEEACIEMFEGSFVFDVEAYCDGGFWTFAQEENGRWTVRDAGELDGQCLAQPIAARVIERDGAPLVLLDAVYKSLDSMRLVNEDDNRTLSVWRRGDAGMERTFSTRISDYAVDLGPFDELRCLYSLEGQPESLNLECCREPAAEEEEEERAGPRYPTEPSRECGPRWRESYPANERGGFTRCQTVSSADSVLRAVPSDQGEEVDTVHEDAPLEVVGSRDGWLEVIEEQATAWILAGQTRRRCVD